MMVRVAVALLMLVQLGCGRSPFPGYKPIGNDTWLRLYLLGDGERLALDGDSVRMRIRIAHVDSTPGSLFSTEQWYAARDLRDGPFNELLIRMHEGDSMGLIVRSPQLPWQVLLGPVQQVVATGQGQVRVEVSMRSIRTAAMIEAGERALQEQDPAGMEQQVLGELVEQLGPVWQRWGSSMIHYTIQGHAEDTARIKAGDLVTISYIGRRASDRMVFDSTEGNGTALTFRFGDKDQVIPGLEIAIHLLREGQEGDFLLPSEYAFGARGVDGMLAPYSPVLYSVRVEEVQRRGRPRPGA
jgi:FKBP-type peptidyl-prolyl cis-trans isomerase